MSAPWRTQSTTITARRFATASDAQRWFIVRNSWDTDWGMSGYFTMPYGYLTDGNLSDDFWTIRVVK